MEDSTDERERQTPARLTGCPICGHAMRVAANISPVSEDPGGRIYRCEACGYCERRAERA
jgi:hypothetical protein